MLEYGIFLGTIIGGIVLVSFLFRWFYQDYTKSIDKSLYLKKWWILPLATAVTMAAIAIILLTAWWEGYVWFGTLLMIMLTGGLFTKSLMQKSWFDAVVGVVCFGYALFESLPWMAALICLFFTYVFLMIIDTQKDADEEN